MAVMYVTDIQVKHFRNYEECKLAFSPTTNVFVGQNAQGKTNILEAIMMIAVAKSHRTSKDYEMIQWDEQTAFIHANIFRAERNYKLQLNIMKHGKKALINGIEKRKMSEFVGHLNMVLFAPEDLTLVQGSPQIRRRFLDIEIGQISPTYLYDLSQYQKVLQQRNQVLKSSPTLTPSVEAMVSIWDDQLVTYGSKIIIKRFQFIKKLETFANDIQQSISSGKETLHFTYVSPILTELNRTISMDPGLTHIDHLEKDIHSAYQQMLESKLSQDIHKGITSVGPHRDDIQMFVNEMPVDIYGSQGQQRTTALSMKLAEIELIRSEVGEYPVLLLDDVLSELDERRQLQLIQSMGEKVQTFITTTTTFGLESFLQHKARIYRVDSGIIQEEG